MSVYRVAAKRKLQSESREAALGLRPSRRPVDDAELVLARVDDEVDRACKIVSTRLVTPRARYARDVRLHAREETEVRFAKARSLGVRDHEITRCS